MSQQIVAKAWDRCCHDPWFVVKFVLVTLMLGAIAKAMLIGTIETTNTPKWAAQFVPTLPMMGLNFFAHKHLWDHKEAKLRSYIGSQWSKLYWSLFLCGHTAFTVFAVWLGWYYLAVSLTIGIASAVVTFAVNEWKIFARHWREMKTET